MPGDDEVILRTERLTLRRLRPDESAILAVYMNDPDVARYQDWDRPEAEIAAKIEAYAERPWPCPGSGLNVAIEHDGELVGDFGVGWDDDGTQANIGYTLRTEHQGRGFATDAAGAVVDRLLADGVRRISSTTDPQNPPSMRVLERLGFRHEGTTRSAVLIRDEWLDDELFALLPEDRRNWLARPTGPPQRVKLAEITPDMARAVGELSFTPRPALRLPTGGRHVASDVPLADPLAGGRGPWGCLSLRDRADRRRCSVGGQQRPTHLEPCHSVQVTAAVANTMRISSPAAASTGPRRRLNSARPSQSRNPKAANATPHETTISAATQKKPSSSPNSCRYRCALRSWEAANTAPAAATLANRGPTA